MQLYTSNYIAAAIAEHTIHGQSLYTLKHQSYNPAGDESAITLLIFEANDSLYNEHTDEFAELDMNIAQLISEYNPGEDWTKDETPNSLSEHWSTKTADYIHIQYSDHMIYVTIFESGQY
jgi:hypothetical protein